MRRYRRVPRLGGLRNRRCVSSLDLTSSGLPTFCGLAWSRTRIGMCSPSRGNCCETPPTTPRSAGTSSRSSPISGSGCLQTYATSWACWPRITGRRSSPTWSGSGCRRISSRRRSQAISSNASATSSGFRSPGMRCPRTSSRWRSKRIATGAGRTRSRGRSSKRGSRALRSPSSKHTDTMRSFPMFHARGRSRVSELLCSSRRP